MARLAMVEERVKQVVEEETKEVVEVEEGEDGR